MIKEDPHKIYIDGLSQYCDRPFFGHGNIQYLNKDYLLKWANAELERLWELLPDADNPNPSKMELRYLGQYMQTEVLIEKLNSL